MKRDKFSETWLFIYTHETFSLLNITQNKLQNSVIKNNLRRITIQSFFMSLTMQ